MTYDKSCLGITQGNGISNTEGIKKGIPYSHSFVILKPN